MQGQRLTFLMLAVAAGTIQTATAADVLTLDQALELATAQNRSLQNSALDLLKAEDKVKANATRQLPSFSVNVVGLQRLQSYDYTIDKGVLGNPGTGPFPTEDVHLKSPMEPAGYVSAKISQPLSSLIRIRRNLDTLKTGVELAKEQTREDRQKTIREVKRQYYALQQVESSLRTVKQTEELYVELARLTENYVAGAVVLKSDLLDIQTRLARTRQNALQLADQRASAKERLNHLMGRDVLTDFEAQPVLETAADELDLGAARDRALEKRPEIRQAALKTIQAQQDLRAKRAEYIPDASAEVSNTTLMNFGNFVPAHNSTVSVNVSWEPFDWGRKRQEMAEKQRTIQQALNSTRDAESAILADVNDRYRALRLSRAQLQVARLAQETAIETLRVTKNRYAVQAALMKDVLQGQVSLEQSNQDYQQALLSFWNARADFEQAIGEDK